MTDEYEGQSNEWGPPSGFYIRVSTQEQELKGTSLESQEAECNEARLRYGGRVAPDCIWRDVESGATMRRDGLQRMLAAIRHRRISRLFFHVQDRLSREPLDTLLILDECEKAGVEVYSTEGLVDMSDTGKLMVYVKAFGFKQERRAILERTQRGKWTVAGKNLWPDGNGVGLFGYEWDHKAGERVVYEVEASVVRQMFQWAHEGINCNRIARMLNAANIPTKRGKLWPGSGVKRVLLNPAYAGVQRFGTTKTIHLPDGRDRQVLRPVEETVEVTGFTPAIISWELYEAVQPKLQKPQARDGRRGTTKLLSGLATCMSCGFALVGSAGSGRRSYYRCNAALNSPNRPRTCCERFIRADWLEPLVWEIVSNAVRDPGIIIGEIRKNFDVGGGNLDEEIKGLSKDIEKLEGQQVRLLQQRQLDLINQELLERMIAPVKSLYDEKKRSLELLVEQQKRREGSDDMEGLIREYCQQISRTLDDADFDEKRAVFAAFSVRVEATVYDLKIMMTVDPSSTIEEESRMGLFLYKRTKLLFFFPMKPRRLRVSPDSSDNTVASNL